MNELGPLNLGLLNQGNLSLLDLLGPLNLGLLSLANHKLN